VLLGFPREHGIGWTDDDRDKSRPAVPADDGEMQAVVLAELGRR
jgi:hypothetical protein